MQTWAVHTSDLPRLTRDLGFAGVICFQLSVGGNVLAALVHPIFLATLLAESAFGEALPWQDSGAGAVLAVLYGVIALAGYLVSAMLGWIGLARRGLRREAWALLLMPVYWLLLSAAAWRALCQLVADPYAWEKTEHGLAKTSRLAASTTRALIKLERHLTYLEDSGRLALPGNTAKQTPRIRDVRMPTRPAAAARRPSRQQGGSLRYALPFLFSLTTR